MPKQSITELPWGKLSHESFKYRTRVILTQSLSSGFIVTFTDQPSYTTIGLPKRTPVRSKATERTSSFPTNATNCPTYTVSKFTEFGASWCADTTASSSYSIECKQPGSDSYRVFPGMCPLGYVCNTRDGTDTNTSVAWCVLTTRGIDLSPTIPPYSFFNIGIANRTYRNMELVFTDRSNRLFSYKAKEVKLIANNKRSIAIGSMHYCQDCSRITYRQWPTETEDFSCVVTFQSPNDKVFLNILGWPAG